MKMWDGRFHQAPDADFEQWQRSLPFDRVLLPYEVAASKVHARALCKAGVLTGEELALTLAALDQIGREGVPQADNPAIEDVHHYVETRLVEIAGEVGWKLHTGRSRNEQIAADLRLYVRDHIDAITTLLAQLASAFVEQAEAAVAAVMPAYTHMQRAEPVLVAHWLLAYFEMFLRDIQRLSDCRKRVNLSPLGSGAVAGAVLSVDRGVMASELGFDSPCANSIDATSDRDFAIEFAQALSLIALHLSRWAEEFIIFSTAEFGFVVLPEQYSTGSSAMPQKKNPDALELIRGKSGKLLAETVSLVVAAKGLPLAYNKDLQETQQPVFSATQQVSSMLRVAAGFMAIVEFNYQRMQQAASTGFMNAQAAAACLVRQGVPFRRAHELVGKAVRRCIERHCELEQLSRDEYRACGIDAGEQFYSSLALDKVLAVHNVRGGTAPARVREALNTAKEKLSQLFGVAHACA